MNRENLFRFFLFGIIIFWAFLIISLVLNILNINNDMGIKFIEDTISFILKAFFYISLTSGSLILSFLFRDNRLVSKSTAKVFLFLSLCSFFFSLLTFLTTCVFTGISMGFRNLTFFHTLSFLFLRLPPQLIFFILFYLIYRTMDISLKIKSEHELTI